MRIDKIKDAENLRPGQKLYLGNRYDIVDNVLLGLNLDRTTKRKVVEYVVPKNPTEEQTLKIKEFLINRTLSFTPNGEEGGRFAKKEVVKEAKVFSYKTLTNMTMSELKYLASKLGIETDRTTKRVELRERLEKLLDKEDKKKK